jgi:lipoprotein-releasing system ATP-binding protein
MLCDEPTGSLDQSAADAVAALLFEMHGGEGNVMICVTHSLSLAARFERRLELRDGQCVEP